MGAQFDQYIMQFNTILHNIYQKLSEGKKTFVDNKTRIFAAMDLTAEFFIHTMDTIFRCHALPKGLILHRNRRIDLSAIRRTGLMTIEAENDVICGSDQIKAAHIICANVPTHLREHFKQPGVGHYGICITSCFQTHNCSKNSEFYKCM